MVWGGYNDLDGVEVRPRGTPGSYTVPRKCKGPRYWPTKNGYYVVVNGQRVCLAKGEEGDPVVVAEAGRRFKCLCENRKLVAYNGL